MRTPRIVALAVSACAATLLSSAAAVAAPSQAPPAGADVSATTTATGRYVDTPATRVLDTRSKIGVPTTTPIRGGQVVSLDLSGDVSSTATSVVLNLAVADPTSSGYLTAYAGGTARPGTSSLNYATGSITRNRAVVRLGAGSKINIYVGTTGSTNITADLTGYFRSSTDTTGGFGSASARILSTRDGIGVTKAGAVPGRSSINFTAIGGAADIPDDASAVVVNLSVSAATASGYATAYPAGGVLPSGASVYFAAGQTTSALAVLPIGDHGQVSLYNGSSGSAQFYADVQGYLSGGDPVTVGALGSLPSRRLLDTRSGTALGAGRTLTVDTFGRGGVPLARVAAVIVTVTAAGPTGSGYLTAYSGSRPSAATLNYDRSTISNVAVVTPDASGRITIYNGSSAGTDVIVDVNGYVLSSALPVPGTTTSRYVTDPTAIAGTGDTSEGCVDGASGATFVLLDIGAQTVTPDTKAGIDKSHPGVALARTNPTVRLTYPNLVTALDSYLSEFARCRGSGGAARIALGTNNDGTFSGTNAYAATTRGADWADQVVDAVDAPTGVAVLGANDIEAGFASTEAQAEQWITSYFAHTSANLVYNGSLDNCPDAYGSTAQCGAVNDDNDPAVRKVWTRAQYVRLTYGLKPGRISVLPQIYLSVPSQAGQWSNLFTTSRQKLIFEGTLTQYGVCNPPSATCGFTGAQGWSALYHALSTVVTTPTLPVATDLQPN